MTTSGFDLEWLPGRYAIGRFPPSSALVSIPRGPFVSITRTGDELSLVCPEAEMPRGGRVEGPCALFRLAGSIDLDLTGLLLTLAAPLAAARIPIFAVSTFDTDYILVREPERARARAALVAAGHRFVGSDSDGERG
jgi:hypothetical protein